MNLADFLVNIRGFTKFRDPEVHTDTLLISWLRMGEEKLSAELRIRDMIQIDTATLTSSRTRMPPDFRSMDFLRILGGKPIRYKTRDDFYENEDDMTTQDYTESGQFLIVGGEISESAPLSVELHYFGDVEQLTADNESWVSRRFPRLLTAVTMEVASLGMIEDEAVGKWEKQADDLISQMNADYKMSIAAGSKLVVKRRSF